MRQIYRAAAYGGSLDMPFSNFGGESLTYNAISNNNINGLYKIRNSFPDGGQIPQQPIKKGTPE